MASLNQQPISFPWEMFMAAQAAKNRNQEDMYQNIRGLGTGFGQLGQQVEKRDSQEALKMALDKLRNTSTNPMAGTISALIAAHPEQAGQLLPQFMKSNTPGAVADYDPTTGTFSFPMPNATPAPAPTAPPVLPPDSSTGTVTTPGLGVPAPAAGAPGPAGPTKQPPIKLDLSTPAGRQMATIMERQSRKALGQEKADASMMFAKARQKLADLAVSKELSRTMNPALAPSGSALGKVAFTNIRSGRNIQTLSKGPVTWQQVSNALSDIAGAYHGGAPFAQEYMNQGFPNVNQKIAEWTTYVTGTPTKNVPDDIRKELLKMSQSLLDLDNAVLKQNAKSQGTLMKGVASPGQIQGGLKATDDFITSSSGGGVPVQPSSQGWDPAKEQRYQEYKRSRGLP